MVKTLSKEESKRRAAMANQAAQGFLHEPIIEVKPTKTGYIDRVLASQEAKYYKMGGVFVILGRMPDTGAYHLSISTPTRYPTWDEVVKIRYALVPDHITMAMILPPQSEYINVMEYCFQLQQVEQDLGDRGFKPGYFIAQKPTAIRETE
jgi:hypothetical protein